MYPDINFKCRYSSFNLVYICMDRQKVPLELRKPQKEASNRWGYEKRMQFPHVMVPKVIVYYLGPLRKKTFLGQIDGEMNGGRALNHKDAKTHLKMIFCFS